jgi:uncharacterized protein (TIGR02145 family)
MLLRITVFILVFITCFANSQAQSIANVRATQAGQKIEINYDLINAGANQQFDIAVYCSVNGGYAWGIPLKKVEGDVGKGVTAGQNKKIVWFVLNERDNLIGENIVFKITANVTKGFDNVEVTASSMKDGRDAHEYKIINIGKSTWMADNLNYKTQAGCWCLDDDEKNCEGFGLLYDWETANATCPQGWHLPTKDEFISLIESFGSNEEAYANLIETGKSGFNAKFGGWRSSLGLYSKFGREVKFWTSTDIAGTNAFAIGFDKINKSINYTNLVVEKEYAYSVRCIKDEIKK